MEIALLNISAYQKSCDNTGKLIQYKKKAGKPSIKCNLKSCCPIVEKENDFSNPFSPTNNSIRSGILKHNPQPTGTQRINSTEL